MMASKLGPVSAMTGIGATGVGDVVVRRSGGKSDIWKRSNCPDAVCKASEELFWGTE
jgi:hypothetical protein